MIEAEVFGDPEGMRALANAITGRADLVAAAPAGFTSALEGADFEGGAANNLRGAGAAASGGVQAAVAELRGIATGLFSDATVVEQQNADAKAKADEANSHGHDHGHGHHGDGSTDVAAGAVSTEPPAGATQAP